MASRALMSDAVPDAKPRKTHGLLGVLFLLLFFRMRA